jgi:hypothetical protein
VKPFLHAKGSVSRWGGKPEDYADIHDFIDSSKMCMPDMRHRAALHNAFGCFVVERVFGRTIINSDGREVSTRDVAEKHVIEDLGFLPSLEDFLDELPMSTWHGGIHRLPKDERPKTPAEQRGETRGRVRAVLSAVGDLDYYENQNPRLIDDVIAAVRGSNTEEE